MFQCDAFQLDAFQNDCRGGGPVLPAPIVIGIPPGRVFVYVGSGAVYVGGAGETVFRSPRGEAHSIRGRARVRLGGEASYCFTDPAAEIRRLDDELMLML